MTNRYDYVNNKPTVIWLMIILIILSIGGCAYIWDQCEISYQSNIEIEK